MRGRIFVRAPPPPILLELGACARVKAVQLWDSMAGELGLGVSLSRDMLKCGLLAGLGAGVLGSGIYWLWKRTREASLHVFAGGNT